MQQQRTLYLFTCTSNINSLSCRRWNRRLIRLRGLAMGREHAAKGVNVVLGPMMNMGRQAQGGRNWEGFGADPFLTGEASYETILGLQVRGAFLHKWHCD
jgi:beta-glucosidase-like glycosyl hydrolase